MDDFLIPFDEQLLRSVSPAALDGHKPGLELVMGTTTFAKDAATGVTLKILASHEGYLETTATLKHTPSDDERPAAIDVIVDNSSRIGALASYLTDPEFLDVGGQETAPIQLCAAHLEEGGTRLDAWVWTLEEQPQWLYSREYRPPITIEQRAAEEYARSRHRAQEAIRNNDTEYLAARVHGIHYLETVEPIKQLKRTGQREAALKLSYVAIESAERQPDNHGFHPAPWYTMQAAIIHRRLKQRDQEIAVLERWLARGPEDRSSEIYQRWAKLTGHTTPPRR